MVNPRQTAKICRIVDLLDGEYIIKDGWEPNHIRTSNQEVSRASIIGLVVGVQDPLTFYIDDGSGKMLVKSFEGSLSHNLNVGEIVHLIGRPRIYNQETFIVPEIVRRTSEAWMKYRQAELGKPAPKKPKPKVEKVEAKAEPEDLVEVISNLDSGEGVEIETIINNVSMKDVEKQIDKLLLEGVVFSNKPGRIKVL